MSNNITHNQILDLVDELFNDGHQIKFSMKGNSMFPAMWEGDIGTVEKCSPEVLKVGDIIVFKNKNNMVCHRLQKVIIENGEKIFITKGDNCNHTDNPFGTDALIGKISSYQRGSRIKSINDPVPVNIRFITRYFPKLIPLMNRIYFKIKRTLR